MTKLRRAARLSQVEIGQAMELEHGKISRIEKGQLPGRFELEHLLGRTETQDPAKFTTVERTFNELTKLAWSPAKSHTYIEQLII